MKLEKILPWAAVIAGAFVVSKLLNLGKSAADVLTSAGEATGGALYEFFHPDQGSQIEQRSYTVKFPDGQFHSVPYAAVDASGIFTNSNLSPYYAGDGRRYQIMTDKNAASAANKIAVYA